MPGTWTFKRMGFGNNITVNITTQSKQYFKTDLTERNNGLLSSVDGNPIQGSHIPFY